MWQRQQHMWGMNPMNSIARKIQTMAIAAAVVTAVAACSSRPDGVLSKGDMADLLADLHQAEGVVDTERRAFTRDSMKMVLRESIYLKHGVTAEQVDSSMMWYGHHIEDYLEVYDEVISILDDRMARAKAVAVSGGGNNAAAGTTGIANVVILEGDSVDVWTASRFRRFYSEGGNDFITYRINRDDNWDRGDIYTLRFKLLNPRSDASVVLMADYDDGTHQYAGRRLRNPGWNMLKLPLHAEKDAKNITVSIGYEPMRDEVTYIDSISLVRERSAHGRPTVSPAQSPDSVNEINSKPTLR